MAGKVFNVATGQRTTLLDAYEEIKRVVGYTGSVNFEPERTGDIQHSLADVSLARKTFGYDVSANFRYGLERTIEWYQSQSN